jgi:carboxypeptidase Taq
MDPIEQLKAKLVELAHIKTALALLSWDQEVNMPPKGAGKRAETMASIAGLLHDKLLSKEFEYNLNQAIELKNKNLLDENNQALVREVEREFNLEKKLPAEFVREFAKLVSESQIAWVAARQKSDFKIFAPFLTKIVTAGRQMAGYLGYKESPYDALLDLHEPGLTASETNLFLGNLKDFLVPFIRKIQNSKIKPDPGILTGKFPKEKQIEFNKEVVQKLGFDFEAGRVDQSTHPFAMGLHPQDIRLTTRYDETNVMESLSGIIHEAGHGLYDQGLPMENFGTPLGEAVSLGIHESQSRMWENLVGKSREFWIYFYPKLQEKFPEPFAKIPLEDFYKAINTVQPSLIRVGADEVTYNLHIILRFEIEKELIEGTIEVADLPGVWNQKIKQYFGLDVPNDAQGCLQDLHWSMGSFGYFPTYCLGNLYSAQFFAAAQRDILDLDDQIRRGQFAILRKWLLDHIHIHGKLYSASDLSLKATGEDLDSNFFINYLKNKYGEIYGIKE